MFSQTLFIWFVFVLFVKKYYKYIFFIVVGYSFNSFNSLLNNHIHLQNVESADSDFKYFMRYSSVLSVKKMLFQLTIFQSTDFWYSFHILE